MLVKVKVLVAQLCPTICNLIDCSWPGSSDHGIPQARILEWIAISFSRGSSQPRDWTHLSCIADRLFYHLRSVNTLSRTSSTMLNRSGKSRHPCLFPILGKRNFLFSPLSILAFFFFNCMIFIKFRKFSSTSDMSIHNKYIHIHSKHIHIHNKKRTEINIKITQVHHSDLEMLMFICICFM